MWHVPEQYRTNGDGGFQEGDFQIPVHRNSRTAIPDLFAFCRASNGLGWEHVSVSIIGQRRCPTWTEMCEVKRWFWDNEDCVMQLHVPTKEHVDIAQYCLHLWRPNDGRTIPLPPSHMV